jgi:hypothetical protein
MKVWLTVGLVGLMVVGAMGGCGAAGVPEEWCELSSAGLWAVGILGLTGLWAPRIKTN